MCIIFVYNSKCVWTTLNKVLNNSGAKNALSQSDCRIIESTIFQVRNDENLIFLHADKASKNVKVVL